MISGAAAPSQPDSLVTVMASLEKNFDYACELLRLLNDTADALTGPRPTPVKDAPNTPAQTIVSRLRQTDININSALAGMREEILRIRASLGMPNS